VLGERRDKNDIEMFIFHGAEGGAGLTSLLDPRWHVPGEFWGKYGLGWYLWTTKDEKYKDVWVEPPQAVKDIRAEYEKATQQTSVEQQVEVMKSVLEKSADNFWVIGVTRAAPGYYPVSKRLENIPDTWSDGWLEGSAKIIRPEQWFLAE
jgi:peptide/nickel transport system substrate-binding protein